jgi:cell division protein FtsL
VITRLNLILTGVLIACALAVVTSQHKARKLYVELQQEQEQEKRFEVEWGQLQLEQSTWAMHTRIEQIATQQLRMRAPVAARIQVVPAEGMQVVPPTNVQAAPPAGTEAKK